MYICLNFKSICGKKFDFRCLFMCQFDTSGRVVLQFSCGLCFF